MPSRKRPFVWLLEKEWRELLVSKSWWVLLIAMGPLVGVSFIGAVRTYAEVSAGQGGETLSPLIGIWGPTFSACELAAVFLLPFVAIRMLAGDRQSGAMKLELQQGMSPLWRVAAKSLILLAGWLLAMAPALIALLLWKLYGGTLWAPELAALLAGHILNALLTIALGTATASLTEHPSTAAILTLAVTIGTWILNFFGAIQGGFWERAASYTPAAMVAEFQHGLVRLSTVLVSLTLVAAGLALTAVWIRLGVTLRRRAMEAAALTILATAAVFASVTATPNWDLSESRGNSFPRAEERQLRTLRQPLRIEVHLAPEDPRRADLELQALSKLRRVLPGLRVDYVAATSSGLFEQTRPGYGEIRYYLGGRSTMSRVTTAEGVLESIWSVAGIEPPKTDDDTAFRGHPLAVQATGAAALFYGVWPVSILAGALLVRRRFL